MVIKAIPHKDSSEAAPKGYWSDYIRSPTEYGHISGKHGYDDVKGTGKRRTYAPDKTLKVKHCL